MSKVWKKFIIFLRLISSGYGAYKYKIILLTIFGFVGGVLEGISVSALIPLFALVTGGTTTEGNFILDFIKEFFSFFNLNVSIKWLLVFIATLFIVKAGIMIATFYVNLWIMTSYQQEIKKRLMDKMLGASWSHLMKQKLGHLETLLSVNVSYAASLLGQIGNVVVIVASLAVYIFAAVNISFPITAVTLILSALLFILLKSTFKKIKLVSDELEITNRDISHHVSQNVLGFKTIKIMGVETIISNISRSFFKRMRSLQIRQGMYGIFRSSLMQPASVILILLIFAFSYKLPTFNLGAFLAVMYLIKQIFSYVEQLQKKMLSIYSIVPYLSSIVAYEKGVDEAAEYFGGKRDFIFKDLFEFKNVFFSYQHDGTEVLKNISFNLKRGSTVGLIGPSGSGKTTMVDLLLRLIHPTKGEIFLDGIQSEEISLEQWRKNIGYVSQDIFLLNGTIEENVRFYDETITEEEIKLALSMANILDFVESCPKKLQTVVGERGVMLSNGQRQRIIISRVLARKPEILVLDEATSALDNDSEQKIHDIIQRLKGKMTIIIIAHRLSTVRDVDRLIIIEDGILKEQGTPDGLLKDENSYFFKAYNARK